MHVFFSSQFGYCLLVWMFHFRSLNNQLNKLKEKALRPMYEDTKSYFGKLLKNENTFTIHHRNIKNLPNEMYKGKA